MNFPEINNDIKQNVRSESIATAKAEGMAVKDEAVQKLDVVQKSDNAQNDKQTDQFSRKELETVIRETEEQLANNDVKLKFNVIEENDTVQVEIQDQAGKTIRKIPDDELIKLSKSLKSLERGFIDQIS